MARSPIEIERKWLVEEMPVLSKRKGVRIIQGYIVAAPEGSEVRLRRRDEKFYETVKTGTGLELCEIEIELTKKQFKSIAS